MWSWGCDEEGQLGCRPPAASPSRASGVSTHPHRVALPTDEADEEEDARVVQIAAGWSHSLALTRNLPCARLHCGTGSQVACGVPQNRRTRPSVVLGIITLWSNWQFH